MNTLAEADLEYVIGTGAVPGGAHETLSELAVTTPDAARATLEAHRHAFEKQGLNAIGRIIALVVQPGVGNSITPTLLIISRQSERLKPDGRKLRNADFQLTSTDYQTARNRCASW